MSCLSSPLFRDSSVWRSTLRRIDLWLMGLQNVRRLWKSRLRLIWCFCMCFWKEFYCWFLDLLVLQRITEDTNKICFWIVLFCCLHRAMGSFFHTVILSWHSVQEIYFSIQIVSSAFLRSAFQFKHISYQQWLQPSLDLCYDTYRCSQPLLKRLFGEKSWLRLFFYYCLDNCHQGSTGTRMDRKGFSCLQERS